MRRQTLTEQAHRVWWNDVCDHIDMIRDSLPADLVGSLQFVTETSSGGDFFHLVLDGAQSRYGVGLLPLSDTLVEINREALADVIAGDVKTAPAFRVQGRDGLFTRLHDELDRVAEHDTWVKLTHRD